MTHLCVRTTRLSLPIVRSRLNHPCLCYFIFPKFDFIRDFSARRHFISGTSGTANLFKMDSEEKAASSSKRSSSTHLASSEKFKNHKKLKKEMAKSHTRRNPNDYDVNKDLRDIKPHEGSYANPEQQRLLGVTLDPSPAIDPHVKMVKRKVALFLGFLGTKYGGFQVNPGQRTIQAEIEYALYRAGMLTELNFGNPHKYSWSSSARTDKGVHACAQVCSLKVELREDEQNDLEPARRKLETFLPLDIRVLDIRRTTRNFCAKTQRDRVQYQYMLPSFLLFTDWRPLLNENGIALTGRNNKDPLSKEEISKLQAILNSYRSTQEQRDLLQAALKAYEGTHPFHNFTKGLKPGQASANRYIESFVVKDPIVCHDIEWIPTEVYGQSFLLHQIRKMVSLAVDVARGAAPLDVMTRALSKAEIIRVGLAPAQGLFLEMSHFIGYNRRKEHNKELLDLDWTVESPARDRWEAFRTTIRDHIVDEECQQGNFVKYLYIQECIFDSRICYKLSPGIEDEGKDYDDAESSGSEDEE